MITERKRWMTYTYYNRNPRFGFCNTHLFALIKRSLAMMICVPFPTITVDLSSADFVSGWSASSRTKINKAGQEQLSIDRGNALLDEVLKLFMVTARLKDLRGYTAKDFSSFPKIETSAIFNDEILLCGHVWIIDEQEKRAMLYVSASHHAGVKDEASLIGRAHYYLLWQDGLFLQQNGIETMDLMGFEPESMDTGLKGVYQWKAATHGSEELLYHYYPIWFYVLRKFRNMLSR